MNFSRKVRTLSIVTLVFVLSISLHYIWDTGQVHEVLSIWTEKEILPHYVINANFKEEEMIVEVSQRLRYKNTTEKSLENIYFHLYPNAFLEKSVAPFEKEDMERAYPNGFDPGWIKITEIKAEGKKLEHKVMGESQTNLRVTPKSSLKPGEDMEMIIQYIVKLPNSVGRTGYGENTVNITNWYPILSVYDEKGWNLDPYYAIGDPFYSEVGKYEVMMTIPKEYEIATTGIITKITEKGKNKTYRIEAEWVRDFAMVLSKKFSVKRETVDGIEVISYTIDGMKEDQALQYGIDSLSIFNNLFGKYPYQQLSVVASDFFIGGMEYPNLVMISQDLYNIKEDFPLEYVIAHEVAHQWWYGIVGNNEIEEPWLDEALTEYSTLMYFEEKYGPHIKKQVFEKMVEAQYKNFLIFEPDKGEGILRSLKEFDSGIEYSSIVYSKGAMFVEELKKEMGKEAFMKAIREYFSTYQFKNARTEDFYRICQKHTKENLQPMFKEWLKK